MQRNTRMPDLGDSVLRPYRWLVIAAIVTLAATGCSQPAASTPLAGPEQAFTAQELAEARRIRPDPRNYGVRMDAAEVAAYLANTGGSD